MMRNCVILCGGDEIIPSRDFLHKAIYVTKISRGEGVKLLTLMIALRESVPYLDNL